MTSGEPTLYTGGKMSSFSITKSQLDEMRASMGPEWFALEDDMLTRPVGKFIVEPTLKTDLPRSKDCVEARP